MGDNDIQQYRHLPFRFISYAVCIRFNIVANGNTSLHIRLKLKIRYVENHVEPDCDSELDSIVPLTPLVRWTAAFLIKSLTSCVVTFFWYI